MDLEAYWQENKNFVTTVGVGALVFLVAWWIVGGWHDAESTALTRENRDLGNKLKLEMYDAVARDAARNEAHDLEQKLETLRDAVEFEPRPRFRIDPRSGSIATQYLRATADTSEQLLSLANRSNVFLDPTLGLPELSPTTEGEIVRYLEALDLVDRVVQLAVGVGVQRIDEVRIYLDSAMDVRAASGEIERTRVRFVLSGPSQPLVRLLGRTQRLDGGAALVLDTVEMSSSSTELDRAKLELVLAIPRLPASPDDQEPSS